MSEEEKEGKKSLNRTAVKLAERHGRLCVDYEQTHT